MLVGCNSSVWEHWPRMQPGRRGAKRPRAPGSGETKLGFISPGRGCERRYAGDLGAISAAAGWLAWEGGKLRACSPHRRNPLPL